MKASWNPGRSMTAGERSVSRLRKSDSGREKCSSFQEISCWQSDAERKKTCPRIILQGGSLTFSLLGLSMYPGFYKMQTYFVDP